MKANPRCLELSNDPSTAVFKTRYYQVDAIVVEKTSLSSFAVNAPACLLFWVVGSWTSMTSPKVPNAPRRVLWSISWLRFATKMVFLLLEPSSIVSPNVLFGTIFGCTMVQSPDQHLHSCNGQYLLRSIVAGLGILVSFLSSTVDGNSLAPRPTVRTFAIVSVLVESSKGLFFRASTLQPFTHAQRSRIILSAMGEYHWSS